MARVSVETRDACCSGVVLCDCVPVTMPVWMTAGPRSDLAALCESEAESHCSVKTFQPYLYMARGWDSKYSPSLAPTGQAWLLEQETCVWSIGPTKNRLPVWERLACWLPIRHGERTVVAVFVPLLSHVWYVLDKRLELARPSSEWEKMPLVQYQHGRSALAAIRYKYLNVITGLNL